MAIPLARYHHHPVSVTTKMRLYKITYLTACCTPMNASCYLFSEVNQSVPNFYTMSKTSKLQLLLFGFPDIDHYEINKNVAKAVQKFSLKTIKGRRLFASVHLLLDSYPGFLVTSTVIRELQQSKKAKTNQTADYLVRWL